MTNIDSFKPTRGSAERVEVAPIEDEDNRLQTHEGFG